MMAGKEQLVIEAGDPLPLVRVWMLGPFVVELREADGVWRALPGGVWRTYFYARPLLQRLLCAHGRRVERQQLQADLWPREEPSEAMERYPLTGAGQVRKLLGRKELLRTCGQGYQLADQRWIWTDVDEALGLVGEARRVGLEREEALPLLEGAERLFRRGRLLEEQGALWAVTYREWVGGERWRAGLALGRLYEVLGLESEAGEQYRQLYEEQPYKEEALLEVYGWWIRQGERERAERVLEAGRRRLEQEGLSLTEEGEEWIRRLREQGVRRAMGWGERAGVVYWGGSKRTGEEERREVSSRKEAPQGLPMPAGVRMLPSGEGEEKAGEGGGEVCGVRVLVWPLVWGRERRGSLRELERAIQEELKMSEREEHETETRTAQGQKLPRRAALLVLAGLPQVLLGLGGGVEEASRWEASRKPRGVQEGRLREEVLPACAGSITACWHLLNEGEFEVVERTVRGYLPWLREWAYEPSGVQQEAAYLAAQACLLEGLIAYHRMQFRQRLSLCQEARALSFLARDDALLVNALGMLGTTAGYLDQPELAIASYEEARQRLSRVVFTSLKSSIFWGIARAYAQWGREDEANAALGMARDQSMAEETDRGLPAYIVADQGIERLIILEGRCYLDLGDRTQKSRLFSLAEQVLARADALDLLPERIRLEIINLRGEAAIGRGELEEYVSYTVEGAEGAKRLGSSKRRQELVSNWRKALERWPWEKRVRELGELVLEL
uniref:Bacterial transcriptional activator domain-containing protein n=1 Tax=Thermogemmatispora argillosa TaxID=2045280 RepID=A0A455SXW8_9CHLR|nr:hypothetical protein KTA_05670 [Thermogemmatispora argillosa]